MLETSAFRIPVRWSIYIINSVDKTKLLYTTPPATQHHSFFRNYSLYSEYVESTFCFSYNTHHKNTRKHCKPTRDAFQVEIENVPSLLLNKKPALVLRPMETHVYYYENDNSKIATTTTITVTWYCIRSQH